MTRKELFPGGWERSYRSLLQGAGSLNIKRLLLIKENQISQIKEFSAFLCMGTCKEILHCTVEWIPIKVPGAWYLWGVWDWMNKPGEHGSRAKRPRSRDQLWSRVWCPWPVGSRGGFRDQRAHLPHPGKRMWPNLPPPHCCEGEHSHPSVPIFRAGNLRSHLESQLPRAFGRA